MKTKHLLSLATALCGLFVPAQSVLAQGTAFTYQGRLTDSGNPYTGIAEFQPTLWNAASGGAQVTANSPATLVVGVTNGLFVLPLDFGNNFPGADRWLQIGVRTNAGPFTVLAPRQPITAAPYAVTAGNVTGALPAAQLSGAIANANLPASPTFSGTVVANSFSGNGGGLTNVNAATLNGLNSSSFWRTAGNAGTTPGTQFLGTTDNQPLEFKVNGQRVLRLAFYPNTYEPGSPSPSLIGGHPDNEAVPEVSGATIAGGGGSNWWGATQPQRVSGHFGTIGGGGGNEVQGDVGVIAGGERGFLGSNAYNSSIGGGAWNTIHAGDATIGGGRFNVIQTNASVSTIGGGGQNTIQSGAWNSTIGGGYGHTIANDSFDCTIGGGSSASLGTNSAYSTIGGGRFNSIGNNAASATVGGGYFNNIGANSPESLIGGGRENQILANAQRATIVGGFQNIIADTAVYGTIVGGSAHANSGDGAFIGGGFQNAVQVFAYNAFIGGGAFNSVQPGAVGATLGGGYQNRSGGQYSTIGGGQNNMVQTNAIYATIPGGVANSATNYAFAAGLRAKANHTGAFVWGDATAADIASANANSVTFRAAGGYRLFSNSGATAGVSLAANGTSWAMISDRNVKKDFAPIDAVNILEKLAALPITQWRYQWEEESGTPHIGPMAQDFKAAFYPGTDDKSITTQEADGVALAAIQGLNEKVESGKRKAETRIQKLEAENAELKQRLEKLEQLLAGKLNGGG